VRAMSFLKLWVRWNEHREARILHLRLSFPPPFLRVNRDTNIKKKERG
jgi:hypothetical protein